MQTWMCKTEYRILSVSMLEIGGSQSSEVTIKKKTLGVVG